VPLTTAISMMAGYLSFTPAYSATSHSSSVVNSLALLMPSGPTRRMRAIRHTNLLPHGTEMVIHLMVGFAHILLSTGGGLTEIAPENMCRVDSIHRGAIGAIG
jgi:hypothetical protein